MLHSFNPSAFRDLKFPPYRVNKFDGLTDLRSHGVKLVSVFVRDSMRSSLGLTIRPFQEGREAGLDKVGRCIGIRQDLRVATLMLPWSLNQFRHVD